MITKRRTPEHIYQSWAAKFLDRALLPPAFFTSIDHGIKSSPNAWNRMLARGVRPGVPDLVVMQHGTSVWFELKQGSRVSASQEGVHTAMQRAGVNVFVVDTIRGILTGLRTAGLNLHANADNLAVEYQERVDASLREMGATKPRVTRPRSQKIRTASERHAAQTYAKALPR